jgi:uncharacterized Zn finger protein
MRLKSAGFIKRQGRVSDLAVTDDGSLIAWVDGTERYATRVVMDEDGLPDSICTCPYGLDCKHGVAVVIEYLKRIENNRRVPKAKRYEDAGIWIQEGIRTTEKRWPGIAVNLRGKLLEIRTVEKNWPMVAAMRVEEFVRCPSRQDFTYCRKACGKAKVWPKVRESLLHYLEKGELPWKQKGWPLPESGLDRPDADQRREQHLRKRRLIEILDGLEGKPIVKKRR